LSDEDLLWLFNDSVDESSALSELRAIVNADILILTQGSKGSLIWHYDSWYEVPAYPVGKLSDTVGAGDTFMASILVWLTKNENLKRLDVIELEEKKDLQNYAAKAAALNCEKQGCNPPWENELL
jgi:fructokinase